MDESLFDDINSFLKSGEVPWPENAPVTESEWLTLIQSAYEARGGPLTEDEAMYLLRWAEGVRIGEVLLGLVLNGDAYIIPNLDGPEDEGPKFRITDKGKQSVNDAGYQVS